MKIKNFNPDADLKLTKRQMIQLKGGDDDALLNNSDAVGTLNFGG